MMKVTGSSLPTNVGLLVAVMVTLGSHPVMKHNATARSATCFAKRDIRLMKPNVLIRTTRCQVVAAGPWLECATMAASITESAECGQGDCAKGPDGKAQRVNGIPADKLDIGKAVQYTCSTNGSQGSYYHLTCVSGGRDKHGFLLVAEAPSVRANKLTHCARPRVNPCTYCQHSNGGLLAGPRIPRVHIPRSSAVTGLRHSLCLDS
jgi:hypothetical protein